MEEYKGKFEMKRKVIQGFDLYELHDLEKKYAELGWEPEKKVARNDFDGTIVFTKKIKKYCFSSK